MTLFKADINGTMDWLVFVMHLCKRAAIRPITVELIMWEYPKHTENKQNGGCEIFFANNHRNYDFLLISLIYKYYIQVVLKSRCQII